MSYRIMDNELTIYCVLRTEPENGEQLFETYDEALAEVYRKVMDRYENAALEMQFVKAELEALAKMVES